MKFKDTLYANPFEKRRKTLIYQYVTYIIHIHGAQLVF